MNSFVPDSDHISRFCRKSSVDEEGRITGQAFKLRKEDKEGLSVNWLEYLNLSSREAEITEVRKIYKEKPLAVKDGSKIAVLNVGETRKYVRKESPDKRKIQVVHKELSPKTSHSRIIGNLQLDDLIIFELLANTVKDDYPSVE